MKYSSLFYAPLVNPKDYCGIYIRDKKKSKK